MKAIFVTSNESKLREARGILGIDLESAALDLPEPQALNVAEVAAQKVLAARAALQDPLRPVLVEDSGIVFGAWNGLPGALTRWFLAAVGNGGLLRMLAAEKDRSARAVCAVAVADAAGEVRVFVGEVAGRVAPAPRGEGGFGWDPIFVPDGERRTYAEMGPEKNRASHRARAFEAARDGLADLLRVP